MHFAHFFLRRYISSSHPTREKMESMVARGEFEDGAMGGGDMQFMAEVRDTLKYFDEKESA